MDLGLAGLGWTVLRGEASLLPAKGAAHLWEVSAGCGWRWGGPQGAEGQRGVAVASSGEHVPSPCSQAGNRPTGWGWGLRQIPKLLAVVSAHLERVPCPGQGSPGRLQLLAASLHPQALGTSLSGEHSSRHCHQVCLVEGFCSAVGGGQEWPWQLICP